jgi:very-short-patch-repair endonuclease
VLDMVLADGLEHPRVNAPYRLPDRVVYPDLWWPEIRLIVEVDSAEWHSDPLARQADEERQARLEAAGERVIRVKRADARTLARLRAAGVPEAA